MESIIFVVISMLTLTGHSLAVNYILKTTKHFNTSTVTTLSVLPAFLVALFAFPWISYSASWDVIGLMFFKESIYAVTLFLRLQSFKNLGAFGGGVLLVAQPVLTSVFAWGLLGESLSFTEVIIISITLSGIWVVHASKPVKFYSISKIIKYLTLPTILMALVTIIDRYLLLGEISAIEFFVVDKIIILPTFLIVFFIFSRLGIDDAKINLRGISIKYLLIIVLVLGCFWGVSTLFYGLALELEKTIWVVLIRSFSFPLFALVGSIGDDEPFNKVSLLGLGMVTIGSVLFAIY